MFVQVFQGQIADADLWKHQLEKWREEIKPKTSGYLGSTSGVTAGGYQVTMARFESEAEARANSDLPEQGAWFEETAKAFDGDVTFHDCNEVDLVFGGGSDEAGFVQIMQGRAKDQEAMRGRGTEMDAELRRIRPDLLGGVVAWHGDGSFTQASYFTSEKEARDNEQAMASSPIFDQFMSFVDGTPTFYDFTEFTFD